MSVHVVHSTKPSRTYADHLIRVYTRPSVLPADVDLEQLRRVLSAQVHADLNGNTLADVIDFQDQLHDLEYGTHPDLMRNRSRTVDNGPELREYLQEMLAFHLNTLLDNAGVR